MLNFSKNTRKEIAYGIVEAWALKDEGQRILDTFYKHGRCVHLTASILTQESHDALEACVDKTFLVLQNIIYEDIADALDDWLDVYKITNEERKYGS